MPQTHVFTHRRKKPNIHALNIIRGIEEKTEAKAYILQINYQRWSSILYRWVLLSVTPETSDCNCKSGPETATTDMPRLRLPTCCNRR